MEVRTMKVAFRWQPSHESVVVVVWLQGVGFAVIRVGILDNNISVPVNNYVSLNF